MDDVRNISYLDLVEYDGESADHASYLVHGEWHGFVSFVRLSSLRGATAIRCWSSNPPEVLWSNKGDHTKAHLIRLDFRHLLVPRGITSLKGLWFYVHLMDRDPPDLLFGYNVTLHEQLGSLKNYAVGRCTLLTSVTLNAMRTLRSPKLLGVRG